MGPGVRMTRRIESSGSWMSGKTMQDEEEGISPISNITFQKKACEFQSKNSGMLPKFSSVIIL